MPQPSGRGRGKKSQADVNPYYDEDGITIYHGDCRDVLPKLEVEADLLITDPPYGVSWQSGRQQKFGVMRGDEGALDVVELLALALTRLKRCGHIYVFGDFDLSTLPLGNSCELIWDKEICGLGDLEQPWGPQHERITFAVYEFSKQNRLKGTGALSARVRKGSILRVPRLQSGAVNRHPTEKPVLLLRQLIESSSVIGDLVLDPFMGSGSTLEAARKEDRRAIGIEIDERYCEVAASRFNQPAFDFR
jgi:site-specific DNA-methyltransferase (adenine-specific)